MDSHVGYASVDAPRLKTILLGPPYAGKTSIGRRIQFGRMDGNFPLVGGCEFKKLCETSAGNIAFFLWNSCNERGFLERRNKIYFRRAGAVLLVYDSSCPDSSDSLWEWYQHALQWAPQNTIFVVVAAQSDKSPPVAPPPFVESENLVQMECSAKTGDGIQAVLEYVAQEAMAKQKEGNDVFVPPPDTKRTQSLNPSPPSTNSSSFS